MTGDLGDSTHDDRRRLLLGSECDRCPSECFVGCSRLETTLGAGQKDDRCEEERAECNALCTALRELRVVCAACERHVRVPVRRLARQFN